MLPASTAITRSPIHSTTITTSKSTPTTNEQGTGDTPLPDDVDENTAAVLAALGYDPVHPEILLQRTGMDVARLTAVLLQLELAKTVHRQADGCYQRL